MTKETFDALQALPDTTPAESEEKLKRLTEAFGEELRAQYQKAWDDPPDGQSPAPGVVTPSMAEAFLRLRFDEIEEHAKAIGPRRRVEPRVTFHKDDPGRFSVRYFDTLTGRELRTWEEIDRVMGWSPLPEVGVSVREVT